MDKKRVLVTGGTGFVGYWMKQTAPGDMKLTCLGRVAYEAQDWANTDWDYIVHLAPVSPMPILLHASRCWSRVLYASSGIIYHSENNNEYRQNKIAWERECQESGCNISIVRLFTFYGEHLDEHKAWTQFVHAAKYGLPIHVWGNGSAIRSYQYGAEMARWLWAILLRGESGQAYDVGSDKPITMLELAKTINAQYGNKSEIIVENRIPDPMPVYLPKDTAKTRRLLNV